MDTKLLQLEHEQTPTQTKVKNFGLQLQHAKPKVKTKKKRKIRAKIKTTLPAVGERVRVRFNKATKQWVVVGAMSDEILHVLTEPMTLGAVQFIVKEAEGNDTETNNVEGCGLSHWRGWAEGNVLPAEKRTADHHEIDLKFSYCFYNPNYGRISMARQITINDGSPKVVI